jgi:hypothetical protein
MDGRYEKNKIDLFGEHLFIHRILKLTNMEKNAIIVTQSSNEKCQND